MHDFDLSFTSSILFNVGIGTSHFTHIFIDESAQMMEAEALIPLSLCSKNTVIVLSGDEKQLGSQVQSRVPGLSRSIMVCAVVLVILFVLGTIVGVVRKGHGGRSSSFSSKQELSVPSKAFGGSFGLVL